MAIKLADTLAPMASFPAAMAEHVNIVKDDGSEASLQSLFDNGELSGGNSTVTSIAKADYDALTDEEKLNGTVYYVSDVDNANYTIVYMGNSYGTTITKTIDENSTDLEVPSAKATYERIKNIINDEEIVEGNTYSSAKIEEKLESIIDDTTTATDTTWSSSKIDTEKLLAKGSLSPTINLGMSYNTNHTIQEFFTLLIEKYGTSGCISFSWADASRAHIVNGDMKVTLNGGLLLWSGQNISSTWRSMTAIYIPHYRSSTANSDNGNGMYKIYLCISDNVDTPSNQGIEYYSGQTVTDVAPTTISFVSRYFTDNSSASKYEVRNGICYVNFYATGVASSGADLQCATLPKPQYIQRFPINQHYGDKIGTLALYPNGNMTSYNIESGVTYVGNFSYPVASS